LESRVHQILIYKAKDYLMEIKPKVDKEDSIERINHWIG